VRAGSRLPDIEIKPGDHNARTGPTSTSTAANSHLEQIRRRCVDARDLRQMAQTLQRSIKGESVSGPTLDGTRGPVLIIDDVADTRELLAIAMQHFGLEVVTASNGLEGLFAAYCLRPAVIFMDVNMPS
jgi:PleD family two-component response regulator